MVSRSSVVPWWGRLLPYVCIGVAATCFWWALDIEGWRLAAVIVGIGMLQLGHDIVVANQEADR
jgi:hypothetical protein